MSLIDIAKKIAEKALLIDHAKPFWSRCAFAAVQLGYKEGLRSEALKGVHKYLKEYDDTPKEVSPKDATAHLMEVMRADFEGNVGIEIMKKRLAPDENLFEMLARLEKP